MNNFSFTPPPGFLYAIGVTAVKNYNQYVNETLIGVIVSERKNFACKVCRRYFVKEEESSFVLN